MLAISDDFDVDLMLKRLVRRSAVKVSIVSRARRWLNRIRLNSCC